MMAEKQSSPVKQPSPIRWQRLAVTVALFAVVSLALGVVLSRYLSSLSADIFGNAWLAYGGVFIISLLVNASSLPLPFAVSIMIAMSVHWNPVLVALFASLGAGFGELSGYYAGYLGKKVAIPEETPGYKTVKNWIGRYGWLAIALLSFQPIIPFEIGGLLAGVTRMPVRKFLPALWLGRFPKYILFIYGGEAVIRLIPFLHR